MGPSHEAKGYVASLDGLRGLAAFGVVLHHIDLHISPVVGFRHGYLAVPFFFSLSGFVIARSYETRLASFYPLKKFVTARLVRLLPMIALGAVLAFALGADWLDASLAFVLMPALLGGGLMFPANPPEWSLFFELFGNVLYALVSRHLHGWRLFASIALSLCGLLFVALRYRSLSAGWSVDTAWAGALLFIYSFLMGVVVQHLDRAAVLRDLRLPFPLIVAVFGTCVLFRESTGTVLYALRDFACVALVFPAVVFACLRTTIGRRTEAACRWAGELSYPLYLIHFPIVLFAIGLAYNKSTTELFKYLSVPVMLAICILVAWIVMVAYDRPVRRMLGQVLADRARGSGRQAEAGQASS